MNSPSQPDSFFAIADPTRRKILTLISKQECSVNDLVKRFNMSQPAISQHLKILRASGVVNVRKKGRQRIYKVNFQRLRRIRDWISQFEEYWERKLENLEEYLKEN